MIRQEIIAAARLFNETGLSAGTSGNISVLMEGFFLITPSGIPYQDLVPEDIVEMDTEGVVISGARQPSSEWHFHRQIYISRMDANAVVHVHSPYATAIACTRQPIPAFHYQVAKIGGENIRCADYATFGTEELAINAITALEDRLACLLSNHGMIAVGTELKSALKTAQEVEELARQYYLSKQLGNPVILDEDEMQLNIEKFRSYGKFE